MKRIPLVLFIALTFSISNHPHTITTAAASPTATRSAVAGQHRCHRPTVRAYARCLTIRRWRTQAQWRALDSIVTPESRWDPCAVYPSMHDCRYAGSNSCGVPQANPCPAGWRGKLFVTRWAQARWLIAYVAGRYGDPIRALRFRQQHGWY